MMDIAKNGAVVGFFDTQDEAEEVFRAACNTWQTGLLCGITEPDQPWRIALVVDRGTPEAGLPLAHTVIRRITK